VNTPPAGREAFPITLPGHELANASARELAYRDEGRPRNEVCPRSGPVTHHPRRPTTMANIPELENTA
jgi:hypothetical protein